MHGKTDMIIVLMYLKPGIKFTVQRKEESIMNDHLDSMGRDDIFWRIGREESPELLASIKNLENVDFRDKRGLTYLHVAAINHKLQVIKLLLEKGANPNCVDKRGATPVLMALGVKNRNNQEILRLFLEHGLDLEKKIHGMTIKETILSLSLEEPELAETIKKYESKE